MFDLATELKEAKRAAIAGHIRPDGDCLGSCTGLALYLRENFPALEAVDVYLEAVPERFRFLKDSEKIKTVCPETEDYDVFFALDAGDTGRLGEAKRYLEGAKKVICIDHHISNHGYGEIQYIEPEASSASELVFNLLDYEKISKEAAEALYMGIAHDTGVFQYSCTSSRTMEIAGKLMEKGIAFSEILEKTFFQKTYIQNQILGRALLESMLLLDKQCIVSAVKKKDMEFYGVTSDDLDGIVSQLRNTAGVEVAIFLYEIAVQEYKVSMRSNGKVDVSKIASYFGGGGHIRAAGCTMQGSVYDVVNNLTLHIEKQLYPPEETC